MTASATASRRARDDTSGGGRFDKFPDAAHIAGDNRRSAGERLDPCIGQSLAGRYQRHDIGRREQGRQVVMRHATQKGDAIGDAQFGRQGTKVAFALALARQASAWRQAADGSAAISRS